MSNKKRFISKLNFLLMFHFNDVERKIIIEDYGEWYDYQLEQIEKGEKQSVVLENPESIVKNLCKERKGDGLSHRSILFRLIFFIIGSFLTQYLVGVYFRQHGRNMFWFLLVSNIIQAIAGACIFDAHKMVSIVKKNVHLLIVIFAMLYLSGWMAIVPSLVNVNAGAICSIIGNVLWWSLFVLCLLYVVCNFDKELCNSYFLTMHIIGFASAVLHLVGTLNIYGSLTQMKMYFMESIILYMETLCIFFILCLRGKFTQKRNSNGPAIKKRYI